MTAFVAMTKTVVLVHGAWHGAWCWSALQAELDRRGVPSLAVELPGHGTEPIHLRFGPTTPPEGAADRWIQTAPGRGWFAYIRIYGPEQAAFDGAWRPGDFELA